MQLTGKRLPTLIELRRGDHATIRKLHLPEDVTRRLMELGFLPGGAVRVGRSAPGGDPRIFEIDGSEVALRRETAAHIEVEIS